MTIVNSLPRVDEEMDTPDIMLGAYLMSHLRHYCENCGTYDTPQWRKGWFSDVLNRSVLLCNACGLKYHKNQYCPYCRYIYGKEQDRTSNIWATCQCCGRWVHSECERKFSNVDVNAPNYNCPNCRRESPESVTAATSFNFAIPSTPANEHIKKEFAAPISPAFLPARPTTAMLADMQTD